MIVLLSELHLSFNLLYSFVRFSLFNTTEVMFASRNTSRQNLTEAISLTTILIRRATIRGRKKIENEKRQFWSTHLSIKVRLFWLCLW